MSQNSFHLSQCAPVAKQGYVVNSTRVCLLVCALLVCLMAFSICVVDKRVTAQGTFPDPNRLSSCYLWRSLAIDSDAKHGSGSGFGMEEKFHYAQNIVSRKAFSTRPTTLQIRR